MSRTPPRILLDANILISFLLSVDRPTAIVHRLVSVVLNESFTLLVSHELIDELTQEVRTKPYLANRITSSQLQRLTDSLRSLAEWIDLGDIEHPRIVRDRDDDYLIALATLGEADMLITGDHDLLALDLPLPFRIVSMGEFLTEIEDD